MTPRWANNLAKRVIRYSVRKMPVRAKLAVLRELCSVLKIVDLSVRGEYGVLSQSPADRSAILLTYAMTGQWAPETNERLVAFFAGKSGTYIDIGANIGCTTIPVAQNENVDCIALEPDPSNFNYLTLNVATNCGHGNVKLYQLAAFKERKMLQFELSSDNMGDHRIRLADAPGRIADGQFNEQNRRTIHVEAVAIDDFIDAKREPVAVKIDAQGAEPFIVEGGSKLMARAHLLIMEIWPYGIARMGGSLEPIDRLLRDSFDLIHLPINDAGPPSQSMSPKEASARLVQAMRRKDDGFFYFDLVATKS